MRKGILNRISYKAKRSKNRGFTLVELIVVLVVLAIIASVAIVGGVSYINRSRFDTNQQNAVSVYQAAQTAVSKKVMNGSIDEWVRSTGLSDLVNIDDLDTVNESAHNTALAFLTYNPKDTNENNEKLYELLSDYFYDRSVFTGTMSVVFDVVATHDGHSEKFSVNVKAAYYSKENTASSGWDTKCTTGSSDVLPNTDFGYRSKTSHVGYFNGTEASVVGPVNLPTNTSTDMLNAIFTLRNGETLDLTWSFFDKDPEHKAVMKVNLKNADDENEEPVVLTIDETKFICDEYGNTEKINMADGTFLPNSTKLSNIVESYEQIWMSGAPLDITKKTKYGLAKVNVKKSASDAGTDYIFPLAISEVQGDAQARYPDGYNNNKNAKYTSYTISLDCIMNRSDLAKSDNTRRYTSERLFDKTPKNIIANLEEATNLTIPLNNVDALRAVNDPVYFREFRKYLNDNPTYFYTPKISNAARDTDKLCVANTLFGDIHYVGTKDKVDGTTVDAANGIDAAITSFRHLSNIRMIAEGTKAHYKIAKDLDWYKELDGKYYTDVRVFTDLDPTGRFGNGSTCNVKGRFHSPAMNGSLTVVSFPAIHELHSNQTLSSLSYVTGDEETDTVFSINNLQMRWISFRTDTSSDPGSTIDEGFGLFGKNSGKIYNIYTNNLNLTLENRRDGIGQDKSGGNNNNSSFSPSSNISVTQSSDANTHLGNRPVGGLVGINEGSLGDSNADESSNTICMSNCMVLGGKYWQLTKNITDGSGGVVGKNTGNTNGLMKICGKFAVTGTSKVGGIIGYSTAAEIGAKLVVDGSTSKYGTSEFSIPTLKFFENTSKTVTPSCAVIGHLNEGGAIGYVENANFTYNSGTSGRNFNERTGTVRFASDYQIVINLPANSVIGSSIALGSNDSGVGGAIGCADSLYGTIFTIKVNNAGYIVNTNTTNNNSSISERCRVGGAIGMAKDGTTENSYIDVINGNTSVIGDDSTSSKGVGASGGAVGRLDGYSKKLHINIQNSGKIYAYCPYEKDKTRDLACGAGGAVGSIFCSPVADINVSNFGSSGNICANNTGDITYAGTGGAIGSWLDKTDSLSITSKSRVFALNRFNISAVKNVGGAIGCAGDNNGEVFAVNSGASIIGSSDFVGGVVGRSRYQNSGLYQATLTGGAGVKGKDFVGGAAGSLTKFSDDGITKLVISDGVSSIEGVLGSNNTGGFFVGGVCGEALKDYENTENNGNIVLNGGFSDRSELVIKGREAVGGSIGIIRGNSEKEGRDITGIITMPTQKSGNRLIINVEGNSDVGGAIGRMYWSSADAVNGKSGITGDGKGNSKISLSVVLRPESHIKATTSNAGGAIGHIKGVADTSEYLASLTVKTVTGTSLSNSGISGGANIGGVVGLVENTCFNGTEQSGRKISVDFSAAPYNLSATATNKDSNVGGAVGYYTGSTKVSSPKIVPIDIKLGSSVVSAKNNNAGGAIGKTDYKYDTTTAQYIIFDNQIKLNTNGPISGVNNVGGIIGYNISNVKNLDSTVKGNISGTGDCVGGVIGKNECEILKQVNVAISGNLEGKSQVGGAIGYNKSNITTITSTVKGIIKGTGDYVGGAVGLTFGNRKINNSYIKITTVNVTVTGQAEIHGAKCVGGGIGKNTQNAGNINVAISGRAFIEGTECVGGGLGMASGSKADYGNMNGTNEGISVVISSDRALRGYKNIGGALGQLANKAEEAWPRFNTVQAEINTGILYEQEHSDLSKDEDACIGSVIGFYSDSNVKRVILKGTGGTVNPGHPNKYFSNCILISATGRSIGGIIGQVGTQGYQTNARVLAIDASEAPSLCVVSNSGSDRIGGWIGSGFGSSSGLSGREESYVETYNVNNVKVVYSTGSEVGGFMGRADGSNIEKNKTGNEHCLAKANINVSLKNATVSGKKRVGGAFGYFHLSGLLEGSINVDLKDHSTIGDFSTTEPLCYNAGGAIGDVSMGYRVKDDKKYYSAVRGPIKVDFDSTSKVYCGGTVPSEEIETAGVGGAIGKLGDIGPNYNYTSVKPSGETYNIDNRNIIPIQFMKPISVQSVNPETAVYSAKANAGGVVGVFVDGTFKRENEKVSDIQYYTNAIVKADGADAGVGGFVGKMLKGTITNGMAVGENNVLVSATGAGASAGGFVGRIDGGSVTNSYTTYKVNSSARYTGGFVGTMRGGSVSYSYVGGHTVQGQYESGKGNITGVANVGGFVGIVNDINATAVASIDNCYTTASVFGKGDKVGGFAGNIEKGLKITNSYSTARVLNSGNNTGSFVGYVPTEEGKELSSDFFVNDQVLNGINNNMNLIGVDTSVTGLTEADDTTIRNGTSCDAHPYDATLQLKSFRFRAVYKNVEINRMEHNGDWPDVSSDKPSLEKAVVSLYNEQGDKDPAEFTYKKNGITFIDLNDPAVGEKISVELNGANLIYGTDYTLSYRYNDVVSPTDETGKVTRPAEVIVSATAGGNYTGSVTKEFTIVPIDITGKELTVELSQTEFPYTGASVSEYITADIITVKLDGEELVYGINYEPVYDRDPSESGAAGLVHISIKGIGNYKGQQDNKAEFTITGASIVDADVMLIGLNESEQYPGTFEHDYTGSEIKPAGEKIVVRLGGRTLIEGAEADYTVEYEDIDGGNFIGVGTYKITIKGAVNYTGSKEVIYRIIKANNTWKYVPQINDCFYGEQPTLTCEADFGNETMSVGYYTDSACSEEHAVDITTQNVGTYYIKLSIPATDNYNALEYKTDFEVEPKKIEEDMITVAPVTYNGEAQTPELTVTYGAIVLEKDRDYEIVEYYNNTNAGTATVTIIGKGNYKATNVTKSFTIVPKQIESNMITVSGGPFVYNGSAHEPAYTIEFNGRTLIAGTDYEFVEYANNINAGNATLTVTGKGNFSGTCSKVFKIESKPLTDQMVTLASESEPYTGSEIKPAVTVKDGETTLVEDTDYTVTYTDNVEPGTAKVAVAGIGNYKDTINKTFTITPPENPDNGNEGGNSEGGNEGSNTEGGNNEGGNSGGNAEGGNNEGGNSEGGNTEGGNTSGGSNEGGNTEGGNTSGGSTTGGNTSGGNAEGGNAGGSTEGGNNTSGGNSTEGNGKSANADKPADSDKSSEAAKPAETPKQDETPKTAETPKEDNTKTADNTKSTAPKTADTTKDTEPAKTTEAPKTAETTKAPESTKSSEKPKTTESTKSSEKPKTVESTKAADTTKDADTAKDAKETKATESTKTTEKPKSKKKSEDSEPKTTSKPKETEAAKSGETEAKTDNN